jgi:hypothetical protein
MKRRNRLQDAGVFGRVIVNGYEFVDYILLVQESGKRMAVVKAGYIEGE